MTLSTQEIAIQTFETLIDWAVAYRNDTDNKAPNFEVYSGICDNLYFTIPADYRRDGIHRVIVNIKNNLICQVPSWSGNYTYPVKGTDGDSAERTWDSTREKWLGEYGNYRIEQACEILYMIKNNWNEELTLRLSPAKRLGIIPHLTLLTWDNRFWLLSEDDDSSCPYFDEIGGRELKHICIDIAAMKIVQTVDSKRRSVKAFLRAIQKAEEKYSKSQAQLKKLEEQSLLLRREMMELEQGLASQHGVKRIASGLTA